MESTEPSKPNFLVIGAQKAGTTWLHKVLRDHPEIYLPELKELEFFSYVRDDDYGSFDRYLRTYFSGVTDEKVIGEVTPSYFWNSSTYPEWCQNKPKGFQENIPKVVRELLGSQTRLILSLRNPLFRAISAYFHHMARGRFDRTQNILEVGKKFGIIHLGFYYQHLIQWYQYFDRKNLLMLIFEEMTKDPNSACRTIFNFLDVDPDFTPPNARQVFHKGLKHIRIGNNFYLPKPGMPGVDCGRDLDEQNMDLVISTKDCHRLFQLYSDDIDRLSSIMGEDLKAIWSLQSSGE